MNIDNASLDEWLAPLKKYQQDTFKLLVEEHGVEEAAKLWLSAQGPKSTVGFGGVSNPQPFHDRFMEEFRKFICGDATYEQVRQQLGLESTIVKGICISTISTALGATIGFTATLLAPAVAAMLYLVGQMGINAWCEVS
ncbi:conserved hypothetical protein [Vibrio chagasii]|nr:conserved hypothetical protein [Vibrio chagasii]CAH7362679.1 conserved hypothetical protein [Vibrio chagasii]